MIRNLKERIIGIAGSASGVTSILGSWQICHSICLVIVALLGFIGITAAGMPLLFLTQLALPFWTVAFLLFLVILVIYFKKKCISKNLILFNAGIIIAGIPFQQLQKFSPGFWIIGGALSALAAVGFVKGKIQKQRIKE